MRTFLRFLKPYRGLCLLTLLVMALDVAGALYLPTIVADMINIGVAGGDLDFILRKGGLMLGVALVSGGGTLMGCFLVRPALRPDRAGHAQRPVRQVPDLLRQ